MTAADLTFNSLAPRITIPIRQLLERFLPSRSNKSDPQAVMTQQVGATVELGALTVVQVVHDLRNRLMVALRCAENLAPLVPDGDAARELDDLRSSAERASLLARELLVSARPQRAARHSVDLNRVVNQCARVLSSALGHGVEADLRLSRDPLFVHADVIELERILLNLVLNARDAIGEDGVITIQTESVAAAGSSLQLASAAPYARLTITDTGSGMTPATTSHVFEPFFTTKPDGTGLGLSLVGYIVRQLQGRVTLTSERGRGTSVTVVLPLSPQPNS